MNSENDDILIDPVDELIDDEEEKPVDVSPDTLRILEAILFASDELLNAARLKAIIPGNPDARDIRKMVEKINQQLQRERHPFEIVDIGGGYQFKTVAYYHPWVRQIFKEKAAKRLSIQALECLAIIAYRQPLSKAEIEAIRGVISDGAMKTLLEKRLITITGRSEKAGRPLLYGTTSEFLSYFGLNKISDLPKIEEFEALARERMEMLPLDELQQVNVPGAECEPEEASIEIALAKDPVEPVQPEKKTPAADNKTDEEEVLLEAKNVPEKQAEPTAPEIKKSKKGTPAVKKGAADEEEILEIKIPNESAAACESVVPQKSPAEGEEEVLLEVKSAPEKQADPVAVVQEDALFEKAAESEVLEHAHHESETIRIPVVNAEKKKTKKAPQPKKTEGDDEIIEVKID